MKATRKHYAVFLSPGTFMSESSERPVSKWHPPLAVGKAERIVERYGAKPYAFYFVTRLERAPVDDGEGGKMSVQAKEVARSGLYHLGGKVLSYAEVLARANPKDDVLLSNMRCNNYAYIVENTNSYRHTAAFNEEDAVVDAKGTVVELGNSPARMTYRELHRKAHS